MSAMSTIPDDTPAIVRVYGTGERCGRVEVVAAAFIPASECELTWQRAEKVLRPFVETVHPGWAKRGVTA